MELITGAKWGGAIMIGIALIVGGIFGGFHFFGNSTTTTETEIDVSVVEDSNRNDIDHNSGTITVNNTNYNLTVFGVIFVCVLIFTVIMSLGWKCCSNIAKSKQQELAVVRIHAGRHESAPKPEVNVKYNTSMGSNVGSNVGSSYYPHIIPYNYAPTAPSIGFSYPHTGQQATYTTGTQGDSRGNMVIHGDNPSKISNSALGEIPAKSGQVLSITDKLMQANRQKEERGEMTVLAMNSLLIY